MLCAADAKLAPAMLTRYSRYIYESRSHYSLLHILHHIPLLIDQWGKVRRIDGGDTMTAALLGQGGLDRRDSTHVRVSFRYL